MRLEAKLDIPQNKNYIFIIDTSVFVNLQILLSTTATYIHVYVSILEIMYKHLIDKLEHRLYAYMKKPVI